MALQGQPVSYAIRIDEAASSPPAAANGAEHADGGHGTPEIANTVRKPGPANIWYPRIALRASPVTRRMMAHCAQKGSTPFDRARWPWCPRWLHFLSILRWLMPYRYFSQRVVPSRGGRRTSCSILVFPASRLLFAERHSLLIKLTDRATQQPPLPLRYPGTPSQYWVNHKRPPRHLADIRVQWRLLAGENTRD